MSYCSLCRSPDGKLTLYLQTDIRSYWCCRTCRLIQVPVEFQLSAAAEKAHYDTHENNPLDQGYRDFLRRLTEPLSRLLLHPSTGLDFGSGPGPAAGILMQEQGHRVENYDPFYAPDVGLLLHKYDFIILTEVIEHLRDPALELVRLWDCLNPGGYLAVMTQMTDDVEDFGSWYYQRDPTHICFWSRDTMIWLSKNLSGAQLSFPGSSLAFLQKAAVEFD